MPSRSDWSQAEAAKHAGVLPPRISDLLRGQVHRFSLDALVNMAAALGCEAGFACAVLTTYTCVGIIIASANPALCPWSFSMSAASAIINVRASHEVRDLIDRAASAQGKTRTDFMLEASTEVARRVLLDQVFFQIDEKRMKAFLAVLEQPIKNKQAVRRLLAKKSPWER